MTEYGYDENLPYVVPYGDGDHARFSSKSIAYRFASNYTQNAVIDTTPKPRVPDDAKFITWFDQGHLADRMAARLGPDFWYFGSGRDYLDNLPGVTPETVFTVLDERKQP